MTKQLNKVCVTLTLSLLLITACTRKSGPPVIPPPAPSAKFLWQATPGDNTMVASTAMAPGGRAPASVGDPAVAKFPEMPDEKKLSLKNKYSKKSRTPKL